MKSKFFRYYSYSPSELKEILTNSILTLDYSLLLDINKPLNPQLHSRSATYKRGMDF